MYARISDDQDGTGLGVGRQEQDCRKLAELRGWSVVTYLDNSVSAYKRHVRRPAFERLLGDLAAGLISGVVVYDLDRLARQPKDLERLIDLYEAAKGLRFATVAGDIDLSGDGVTMARVMIAFANKASKDTGRRVARKHLELAQAGVPVGGTRPFGYRADKKTLEPREAEAIRRAVEALILGESIASVVRLWNNAALVTPRGGRWVSQTVKQVIRNPRIAGLRARKVVGTNICEIVRDAEGNEVLGQWQPVVTRVDWDAANAVLERNAFAAPTSARKYLLSGICRCGKIGTDDSMCNAPMRAMLAPRGKHGRRWGGEENFYYQCPPQQQGGCGGVARSGPTVDALIEARILARAKANAGRVEGVTEPDWPGENDLAGLRTRIQELQDGYRGKQITAARFFAMLEEAEQEERALSAARRIWHAARTVTSASSAGIESEWTHLSLERKRALVGQRLHAIIIHPVLPGKGSRTFNPDLIQPVWRA